MAAAGWPLWMGLADAMPELSAACRPGDGVVERRNALMPLPASRAGWQPAVSEIDRSAERNVCAPPRLGCSRAAQPHIRIDEARAGACSSRLQLDQPRQGAVVLRQCYLVAFRLRGQTSAQRRRCRQVLVLCRRSCSVTHLGCYGDTGAATIAVAAASHSNCNCVASFCNVSACTESYARLIAQ